MPRRSHCQVLYLFNIAISFTGCYPTLVITDGEMGCSAASIFMQRILFLFCFCCRQKHAGHFTTSYWVFSLQAGSPTPPPQPMETQACMTGASHQGSALIQRPQYATCAPSHISNIALIQISTTGTTYALAVDYCGMLPQDGGQQLYYYLYVFICLIYRQSNLGSQQKTASHDHTGHT